MALQLLCSVDRARNCACVQWGREEETEGPSCRRFDCPAGGRHVFALMAGAQFQSQMCKGTA